MISPLLLVEDDRNFSSLMTARLTEVGYSVSLACTGPLGLHRALANSWQAVILDAKLPGMSGFEVLRCLRQSSGVPVLLVAADATEDDQIAGLEGGADDVLPKNLSMRAFLARLRAVTRRNVQAALGRRGQLLSEEITVVGRLRLCIQGRQAVLDGRPLALTSKSVFIKWFLE